MKRGKKAICALMAVLILLSGTSLSAYAQEPQEESAVVVEEQQPQNELEATVKEPEPAQSHGEIPEEKDAGQEEAEIPSEKEEESEAPAQEPLESVQETQEGPDVQEQLPKHEQILPEQEQPGEESAPQTDAPDEKAVGDPAQTVELPKLHKEEQNADADATVTVTVEKVWDDDNDALGLRPEEICFNLYNESEGHWIEDTYVTEADGWTATFTAPKFDDDGNEIAYSVTEDYVENYVDQVEEISRDEDSISFRVTNTYTPSITVTVEKVWDDDNDALGLRPEEIVVYAVDENSGDGIGRGITEEGNWTATFTVPKYDADGNEIAYTVDEDAVPYYTPQVEEISRDEDSISFRVTNTYTPSITVTVEKVWDDDDDALELRPEKICFNLYNESEGQWIEDTYVTEADGWTATFIAPKYDADGNEIEYSVYEDFVLNYTSQVEESGREEDGVSFRITNTYTPMVELTVTKIWDDDNDAAGLRPDRIDVYAVDEKSGDGICREITEEDGWTATFAAPKYDADGNEIAYTIEESAVPYYTPQVEEISRDEDGISFQITNTYYYTPPVTIMVEKVWDDDNDALGLRPEMIGVHLYNVTEEEWIDETSVTEEDGWTATFTVPKYDADGNEIEYSVSEDEVAYYTPKLEETGRDEDSISFRLTNVYTPHITVTVEKVWDDDDDAYGKRPEEIYVNLYTEGDFIIGTSVTEEDGWTATFTVPKFDADGNEIEYTVEEDFVPHYTAQVEETGRDEDGISFQLTNTYTPMVEFTVTKTWEDDNDAQGIRPGGISVYVLGDDELVAWMILDEEFDWSMTTYLPRCNDEGEEILYTVEEDEPVGYRCQVEMEREGDSITAHLTNTSVPVVEVTLNVEWDDSNNEPGVRPDVVFVDVYGNDEYLGYVPITEEDGWTVTIYVEKFDDDGNEIAYVFAQDEVSHYSTDGEVTEETEDGVVLTITNKYIPLVEITVEKVWNDDDNALGLRPDEITANLYANGEFSAPIPLSEEDGWTASFFMPKLDEYDNEIEYTVAEEYYPNYVGSVEVKERTENAIAFTITNTPAATKEIVINKVWIDDDNVRDLRTDVDVELYGDGEYITTVTLSQEDGWTATLYEPMYDDDGREIEYTLGEMEPYYYTGEITAVENDQDTMIFTVTNTLKPLVCATVEKVWDDNDDALGLRPDYIVADFYADGAYEDSVIVCEDEDWVASRYLLKYDDEGKEIEYTLVEDDFEGYTGQAELTDQTEDSIAFTLTNTLTPTKAITVEKYWDDDDDALGLRCEAVQFELYGNGELIRTFYVHEMEDWTATIHNRIYDQDGNEITYTLKEVWDPHYLPQIELVQDSEKEMTFRVTNTYVPSVSVTVEKVWDDNNDAFGLRPEEVYVSIYGSGDYFGDVLLSEENGWSYTYEDLPMYQEDGTLYEYTVEEEEQFCYVSTVICAQDSETEKTFTIINSPASVTVTLPAITKVIQGDKPSKDETFRFVLSEITWSDGEDTPLSNAPDVEYTICGAGSVELGEKTFVLPGGYMYWICELDDGAEGYSYDQGSYLLVYTVEWVGDGLSVEETIVDVQAIQETDSIVFTNTYTAPKTPDAKPTPKPASKTAPKTGDDSHLGLYLPILLTGTAALASLVLIGKKRRDSK